MYPKLLLRSLLFGFVLWMNPGLAQESFRPAQFAGLRIGRDTIAVARQKLGTPKDFFRDRSGTDWVYYSDIEAIKGRVEIRASSKTGVVGIVTVFPDKLSVKDATDHFGPRFRVVRYNICGDGSLIESSGGSSRLLLYPEQGVFIQMVGERVSYIAFLSEALKIRKSKCPDAGPGKVE